MQETPEMKLHSFSLEDTLEYKMATHSSILAWKIPWAEEPVRLQSMVTKDSDMTEHVHVTVFPLLDLKLLKGPCTSTMFIVKQINWYIFYALKVLITHLGMKFDTDDGCRMDMGHRGFWGRQINLFSQIMYLSSVLSISFMSEFKVSENGWQWNPSQT